MQDEMLTLLSMRMRQRLALACSANGGGGGAPWPASRKLSWGHSVLTAARFGSRWNIGTRRGNRCAGCDYLACARACRASSSFRRLLFFFFLEKCLIRLCDFVNSPKNEVNVKQTGCSARRNVRCFDSGLSSLTRSGTDPPAED